MTPWPEDDVPQDGRCPFSADLAAWLQGELTDTRRQEMAPHVSACASCRSEAAALEDLLRDLGALKGGTGPHPALTQRILLRARARIAAPFRRLGPAAQAVAGVAAAASLLVLVATGPAPPGAAAPAPWPSLDGSLERGVGWLLEAQERDGSWSPARWGGQERYRIGLTGLALSALVRAGDPAALPVEQALDLGVAWLRRQQGPDGGFGPPVQDHLYDHAPATVALLRVRAAHPWEGIDALVRPAVRHLLDLQAPSGGWCYGGPGHGRPNAIISAWPLEALQLARDQGMEGLDEAIARAHRWYASLTDSTGRTGYDRPGAFPHGAATPTAIARFLVGRRAEPGAEFLLETGDLMALYFTAAARPPQAGRRRLAAHVAGLQVESGSLCGSFRAADSWSGEGGRVYGTAMSLLTLAAVEEERPGPGIRL